MLRACVRTVSRPIESVWAIWALVAPSWSSSSTSASRGVSRSGALRRPGRRCRRRGGRARQHVHPARGQVDRVDHVAALGLLREAGRGPERQHLVALRRGGPVGEHHDARGREGLVQLEYLRRALERAEVEHRHVGRIGLDRPFDPRGEHLVVENAQIRVLVDQVGEADRNQVFELCNDHADGSAHSRHLRGDAGGRQITCPIPLRLPRRSLVRGEETERPVRHSV